MPHFDVVVDFHDNAVHDTAKRCETAAELTAYLARVPDMLGFYANGKATISITPVFDNEHPKLPTFQA